MVRIALLAADSEQYAAGVRPRPRNRERRVAGRGDAALAEAQTRDDQNDGATASYEEAARAPWRRCSKTVCAGCWRASSSTA